MIQTGDSFLSELVNEFIMWLIFISYTVWLAIF